MNYHKIDMQAYPRKAHFAYFSKMGYPYAGVTVNVDITNYIKKIKQDFRPFFLSFLYLIARSANSVPEFRRRIRDNEIIEFDCCKTSHTVLKPDGTFAYCELDCEKSYEEFVLYAKSKQEETKKDGTIEDDENVDSLYFVSSVPWFSQTALIQPTPNPADSNPRITWGKYFEEGAKVKIPVSILAHHALVDGVHFGMFYERLQKELDEF